MLVPHVFPAFLVDWAVKESDDLQVVKLTSLSGWFRAAMFLNQYVMFDWWFGSVVIMFPWDVHRIILGCSRWVVSPAMASTDAKGRRNGRRNVKQLVETFAPKPSPKNDCFIGKPRTEPIFQGSRPQVEVLGLSFCLLTWQNFNEEAMYPLRSWPPPMKRNDFSPS